MLTDAPHQNPLSVPMKLSSDPFHASLLNNVEQWRYHYLQPSHYLYTKPAKGLVEAERKASTQPKFFTYIIYHDTSYKFPRACGEDSETTCGPSSQGVFSWHSEFQNSRQAIEGEKPQDDIEEADNDTANLDVCPFCWTALLLTR